MKRPKSDKIKENLQRKLNDPSLNRYKKKINIQPEGI